MSQTPEGLVRVALKKRTEAIDWTRVLASPWHVPPAGPVGQSLGYYNSRFEQIDYRRAQLRRPGRGLRWVVDDRGDYLLINRSGRIMQVMVSGYEPRDRRQPGREDASDEPQP